MDTSETNSQPLLKSFCGKLFFTGPKRCKHNLFDKTYPKYCPKHTSKTFIKEREDTRGHGQYNLPIQERMHQIPAAMQNLRTQQRQKEPLQADEPAADTPKSTPKSKPMGPRTHHTHHTVRAKEHTRPVQTNANAMLQPRRKPHLDEMTFASKPAKCGTGIHFRVPKRIMAASEESANVYEVYARNQMGKEMPPFPKKIAICGSGHHLKIPSDIESRFDREQKYRIQAKRI